MKLLRRQILEGERFPPCYGLAYINYECNYAVAYPIPLNIIVSLARAFYLTWSKGYISKLEKTVHDVAYKRGYEEGVAKAGKEFEKAVMAEASRLVDKAFESYGKTNTPA